MPLENNIGKLLLDIEAEDFKVPKICYKKLEDILVAAREHIDTKEEPKKIFWEIAVLLEEKIKHPFTILSHLFDTCIAVPFLFSRCLLTNMFDCKKSLLYIAIAEELGLPVKGVYAPEHMFVRWDDGRWYVNWETVLPIEIPDDTYRKVFKITDTAIKRGVYLKSLTREELKAIAYLLRGNEKFDKGNFESAIKDFTIAISLHPNFVEAYSNRGLAKYKLGDAEGAIRDYNMAQYLKF